MICLFLSFSVIYSMSKAICMYGREVFTKMKWLKIVSTKARLFIKNSIFDSRWTSVSMGLGCDRGCGPEYRLDRFFWNYNGRLLAIKIGIQFMRNRNGGQGYRNQHLAKLGELVNNGNAPFIELCYNRDLLTRRPLLDLLTEADHVAKEFN